MASKDQPVIIVKRPRQTQHGHHGGSWKVAYADFVTALMAFFLVLWIVGQSKAVRSAVGAYFRDPGVFEQQRAAGMFDGDSAAPAAASGSPAADRSAEYKRILEHTAERLREILGRTGLKTLESQIEIQMTREGLRIELIDSSEATFFDSGSDIVKPATERILAVVAGELATSGQPLVVEGHTDSAPYGTATYTNWELSADRANAARRILQRNGVTPTQVRGVRGYADTVLRVPDRLDPRNRRVSIIVQLAAVSG